MGVYLNTTENDDVSFANKIIIEDDAGTYTGAWLYVDTRPAFADLNGDGMIDMVTTAYSTDRRDVYIYSNISTEENIDFNLELIVQSGGEHADWPTDYDWSAYSPALADIDGDGKLDIIVANGTCIGCSPSGISILRNTSTDSELGFEYEYSDFYQYQSNSVPVGIGVSDLNGDGKPDLLTNDWMGGISIMVNSSTEGNIALEEQMIIGVGNFPLSIATADLNMDSTPEIVVSNWEVEGLRVIHNFLPVNNSGIQGDLNGDGGWNVLDIVTLANCILANNCGGRIDDASASRLLIRDNMFSIEADGFVGGVQMTLAHGKNFEIDMTDRALFADYLTLDNETRLLVITPETDDLFSFSGDFEITEVIVANSQYEISVELPLAASFTLSDAYPNPFNPTTTMTLVMPVSGDITVEFYNLLGQVVATLASGYMEANTNAKLTWDASDVSSGTVSYTHLTLPTKA